MRGRIRPVAREFASEVRLSGLTFVALIALAIGIAVAYRAGSVRARRDMQRAAATADAPPPVAAPLLPVAGASTRRPPSAEAVQLRAIADDRARLFGALADALGEAARWKQIVIDIERNAPPPLLDAPGTPDDLKLIVGVGPVIERMLYQAGIATYRQIARLSERDIDAIDARLSDFPGRIRRDGWVAQARSLHLAKYGTNP
jgi:predicted flap endonuclease-1-like 5' DNA nuclease